MLRARYKSYIKSGWAAGDNTLNERLIIMADKTPNYSDAQVALILATIEANGGVANKSVAETLAVDPRMNDADGNARNVRSIIAKMTRMDVNYQRQQPTTKDGKPVQKKNDLVARIATLANVPAAKLDGLEKAPKLALDTLAEALAA